MQWDQPWAKFRLKSDSNCILIDFFDPIWDVRFIRRDDTIQIWTQNLILNSNLVENIWNLIENGQKQLYFWLNSPLSIKFDHFWLNNRHLDGLFWSFNQKMIKIYRFWSFLIEIRFNFNQNCDRWLEIVVEIRIRPKSTIKFEIRTWFVDNDSIW